MQDILDTEINALMVEHNATVDSLKEEHHATVASLEKQIEKEITRLQILQEEYTVSDDEHNLPKRDDFIDEGKIIGKAIDVTKGRFKVLQDDLLKKVSAEILRISKLVGLAHIEDIQLTSIPTLKIKKDGSNTSYSKCSEGEKLRLKVITTIALLSVAEKEKILNLMQGIDIVYHLAAAQHEANVPDQTFYDANVKGTENVLEASVRSGVKRFVHGSTIGVYGSALVGNIDEESLLQPDNIYGKTKLEGEKIVLSFNNRLPVVIIRISETYGPGDRRLLKLFKAINKNAFFMIGNGMNIHHLIYIDDLINGLVIASTSEKAVGEVFVLAGKEPVTTNEMVKTIAKVLDKRMPGLRLPLLPFIGLAIIIALYRNKETVNVDQINLLKG